MDVSQYLDVFIDESNEHIQALSDNIMVLEKEPENTDVINEIFRAAHSLKGMAGTMGFKKLQHLTHDMENVFQEIRNGNVKANSKLIDILFDCLDAIEKYVDTVRETSNEGEEDNAALIQRLNDFLAGSCASDEEAAELFMKIGFYRLRGSAYQFYDKQTKTYKSGTTLDQILQI